MERDATSTEESKEELKPSKAALVGWCGIGAWACAVVFSSISLASYSNEMNPADAAYFGSYATASSVFIPLGLALVLGVVSIFPGRSWARFNVALVVVTVLAGPLYVSGVLRAHEKAHTLLNGDVGP